MKKITQLFLLLICCTCFAQRQVDGQWKKEVNTIFANLDKNQVPQGLLLDYAMDFTNVAAYNGKLTDSTHVNVNAFSDIYKTLLMAKVYENNPSLPSFDEVGKNWAGLRLSYNKKEQNTLVLGGLLYEYAELSTYALERGAIAVRDNKYYDVYKNGVLQNPYVTSKTFAFAAPVLSYNTLEFNVVVPSAMFLSNISKSISSLEADFNDGRGYTQISLDSPVAVKYQAGGQYNWSFRVKMADGSTLLSDLLINIFDIVKPKNYVKVNGAKLRIQYAPSHNNRIVKPLIVAEGFDSGSILSPETDGGDRTLVNFTNSLWQSTALNNLLTGTNQQYDIIYIDWDNGTADLRNNSVVLETVIKWVNDNKISSEPNVLLGQSMGGVIGRYTLARMEQANRVHNVSLFISHDSPQQGSNTPLSLQFFSRHMYNLYADSPSSILGENVIPLFYDLADLMSSVMNSVFNTNLSVSEYVSPGDALTVQDTPAAVQMNYEWVTFSENVTRNLHDYWQHELESKGYPTQCRNIAISNGHECGVDNGFAPGAQILNLHKTGPNGFWRQLLYGIGTPLIGIALDDIELVFLGLLPGKSKYSFDFVLKTAPNLNSSERNVYTGKIKYQKKLLWIGPTITHTISERNKSAAPTSLPYETYSGGTFNVEDVVENLPSILSDVQLVNPTYGFIPVVSALDIKRNNQNVNPADYIRTYAGGNTFDAALTSPFDNFIVEYRAGLTNGRHITFQQRTGNWLADELNGNNPVATCEFMCSLAFTGPSSACDTQTFTVTPGAPSYVWVLTEGADIVTQTNSGNTITLNRRVNRAGYVTISVTVGSADCGSRVITKRVYFGTPSSYLQDMNTEPFQTYHEIHPYLSNTETITLAMLATNKSTSDMTGWEWEIVFGNVIFLSNSVSYCCSTVTANGKKSSGRLGFIRKTSNNNETIMIKTRAANECGWGDWHTYVITPYGNRMASSNYYTVYPNPSSDIVNITLADQSQAPDYSQPIIAELYDMSNVLLKKTEVSSSTATIDVSDLAYGIYVLKINIGGMIESHQIAVSK